MYRKVMSTHMHAGDGGKQERGCGQITRKVEREESRTGAGSPGREQIFATLSGPMHA
jgi:hypothetical protein